MENKKIITDVLQQIMADSALQSAFNSLSPSARRLVQDALVSGTLNWVGNSQELAVVLELLPILPPPIIRIKLSLVNFLHLPVNSVNILAKLLVRHLSLIDCQLTDLALKVIASNRYISHLNLIGTKFSLELLPNLASSTSLNRLTLSHNVLTDTEIQFFATSVISELVFDHNKFTERGVLILFSNTNITYLDLSNNSFPRLANREICAALRSNNSLRYLNLAACYGVAHQEFIASLAQLPLVTLKLGHNSIDHNLKDSLAKLAANKTLRELHLDNNKITLENLANLARSNLHTLNLSGNSLGAYVNVNEVQNGLLPLATSKIDDLDLSNNGLTEVQLEKFVLAMQIQKLNISFNKLGDAIAIALANNKYLTALTWENSATSISSFVVEALVYANKKLPDISSKVGAAPLCDHSELSHDTDLALLRKRRGCAPSP